LSGLLVSYWPRCSQATHLHCEIEQTAVNATVRRFDTNNIAARAGLVAANRFIAGTSA